VFLERVCGRALFVRGTQDRCGERRNLIPRARHPDAMSCAYSSCLQLPPWTPFLAAYRTVRRDRGPAVPDPRQREGSSPSVLHFPASATANWRDRKGLASAHEGTRRPGRRNGRRFSEGRVSHRRGAATDRCRAARRARMSLIPASCLQMPALKHSSDTVRKLSPSRRWKTQGMPPSAMACMEVCGDLPAL